MLLVEGITPFLTVDIIKHCKEAGIRTVLDFISLETEVLSQKIATSYKDVSSIQRILLACYASFPQSGDTMYEDQLQTLSILNTGSPRLDEFLEGGVYTGEITEIHGLPGAGKTQLCLSFLATLLSETGSTAVYIDTNGSFSSGRLEKILQEKLKDVQVIYNCLNKVKVIVAHDIYHLFDILHHIKSQLCEENEPFYSCLKLIVLDAITPVVSSCLFGLKFDGHGLMCAVAQQLKLLCYEHNVSIVVCNNMVFGDHSEDKPALGRFWKHVPSVTLCVSTLDEEISSNMRMLSIKKSCRKDTTGSVKFAISDGGISDILET